MRKVSSDDTTQQLAEIANQAVVVPLEGGLASALESAAAKAPAPKQTVAEIASQLARPLEQFLLNRVPSGQGHQVNQATAAEILRRKGEACLAIESALNCIRYALDQSAPHPDDPNWATLMQERQIMEEFTRSRWPSVFMLPHLRRAAQQTAR